MHHSHRDWSLPVSETHAAIGLVEDKLRELLVEIDTPEKAEALVDRLVADAEEQARRPEQPEVEPLSPEARARHALARVDQMRAEHRGPIDTTAFAIEAIAQLAESLQEPAYQDLLDSLEEMMAPELEEEPAELERPRRYIRDVIMRRMSPLQRYDTGLFLLINNGPRSAFANVFFHQISFWFNGGNAWLLGVGLLWPFRRRRASLLFWQLAPPIWFTGVLVEVVIKKWFRRRRPFIDVVHAIVIGRHPGNWSFPSGHTAVAFAGARMLDRATPRRRRLWYSIASLVGFSRVYLGAHYPSDVLAGSIVGILLAELAHRLQQRWTRRKGRK